MEPMVALALVELCAEEHAAMASSLHPATTGTTSLLMAQALRLYMRSEVSSDKTGVGRGATSKRLAALVKQVGEAQDGYNVHDSDGDEVANLYMSRRKRATISASVERFREAHVEQDAWERNPCSEMFADVSYGVHLPGEGLRKLVASQGASFCDYCAGESTSSDRELAVPEGPCKSCCPFQRVNSFGAHSDTKLVMAHMTHTAGSTLDRMVYNHTNW